MVMRITIENITIEIKIMKIGKRNETKINIGINMIKTLIGKGEKLKKNEKKTTVATKIKPTPNPNQIVAKAML